MSSLDMSLDDMIKMNKKSRGPSPRGRARNSGPGPSRRFPNRSGSRTTPYTLSNVQAPDTTWGHDMFEDHAAAYPVRANRVSGMETGAKLSINNLDYGVSNEDLKELFSEVGDIKRCSIHYDRSGRSKGSAEVVFSRRKDAEVAVKRYNNVQLDGNPMKIEIVGTNNTTPSTAVTLATHVMYGNQNGALRSQSRGGVMGRLRGGSRPMRGRGRGRGRGGENVSAEDLDADLEKYHAEAMQTN